MAETCTMAVTPAAAAASATLAAPSAWTSSKLWPRAKQNAAEIDHGIRARQRRGDLVLVGDIAFDEIDLADLAQRTQEKPRAGRRAATLMRQPARASARTV